MKNEARKRQRTLVKAKTLSDADLLQVLAARNNPEAKAKAKAKGKGKAKAKAAAVAAGAVAAGPVAAVG